MPDNEHRDLPRYFHVAPMILGEGSIIAPGNWGRILRKYTAHDANGMLYREHVLEQVRAAEFPEKPSRLDCVFLLQSLGEAIYYRDNYSRFGVIYEVSTGATNSAVHLGNYNFNARINGVKFMEGMPQIAREYWAIEPTETVEVLFTGSVTVMRRH